ncbi:unnamed protein product [Rotaria magnacalcarata]|uniref:Uncharacterized protein n=1 Tax=Rotaria magnacalcarata TaxID=392030 RepID=A0A8S3BX68_9BILA|nr:unnamed protein product [Rotaria magnacalcarata]
MASSSRILLPFALWPESPPSLSVSSLFINFASDDLITGTNDGFIVCWKILSDHQKIIPRLMLIGHTNQVAFIVASLSTHQIEQFVSISDNDGYVIKQSFQWDGITQFFPSHFELGYEI